MVDYSPVRLLPLAWESPERCNLFGLLGNFQRCLQCGSDKFPNKLRYFPLANIRAAANMLSLHLQPFLFRWLYYPPCGLDLLYWLCRIGGLSAAQILVQVVVPSIVYRHVLQAVAQYPFQVVVCVPSCRVIVKVTADSGVGRQYAFRFREVGNGVEYDIVLRIQSWVLRIVLHSNSKE